MSAAWSANLTAERWAELMEQTMAETWELPLVARMVAQTVAWLVVAKAARSVV
jgi:hypothetical protein